MNGQGSTNERASVLVVDDQAPNRRLLADLLAFHGYAVETAAGGREALEKIRAVKPDLVLLDVVMPDLSGYEVCKVLRADPHTGILPVVMVTALDPAQERVKGLEAGADDFLSKPINPPELLARVRSLLRIKTFHDTVEAQARELAELNAGLEKRVQEQLGELQRLTQLKRFFPPHLAERIVAGDVDDPLATRRREVTVVILDLRGFTAFADTSEPEEVMSVLRLYHSEMGRLIQAHGGTLEQFSGEHDAGDLQRPGHRRGPGRARRAHGARDAAALRGAGDNLAQARPRHRAGYRHRTWLRDDRRHRRRSPRRLWRHRPGDQSRRTPEHGSQARRDPDQRDRASN